jgi:hypothetical protein
MSTTTDPTDPRLGHGVDTERTAQHDVYMVLSDDERARGFVRPVRRSYVHVGRPGPKFHLVDLTAEQAERYADCNYVKYEPYPESERPSLGRYWTQAQLDAVDQGCGASTRMAQPIAETYARSPGYYGATYCVSCGKHLPVGADGEFVWDDGTRVGT